MEILEVSSACSSASHLVTFGVRSGIWELGEGAIYKENDLKKRAVEEVGTEEGATESKGLTPGLSLSESSLDWLARMFETFMVMQQA